MKQERDSFQDVTNDVNKNYIQKICWGMLF